MVHKTELLTFSSLDLLAMLGTSMADAGSLTFVTGEEGEQEVDLDDLCMVVRIESSFDCCDASHVLPFEAD